MRRWTRRTWRMLAVRLLSAVGLCGGICLCLLAFSLKGRAQTPASSDPAAANTEAPGVAAPTPATETEILANQGATFSAKDRVAVFTGSVIVKDPRFNLSCDELTVYLSKGAVSAAVPTPAAGTTPPPMDPAAKAGEERSTGADRSNGLERAVAKGHVVITQKRAPTKAGEEEKVSVGTADTAEYDSKTGDMTLRGTPKVVQNGDSHEALSKSTYMILHRDNSLETHGPSSTHIAPRGNNELPGGKPGGSPPAGSPGKRAPQSGKQS